MEKLFHVGDVVRIRKDLVFGQNYGGHHLGADICKLRGELVEINNISEWGNYWIKGHEFTLITNEMIDKGE